MGGSYGGSHNARRVDAHERKNVATRVLLLAELREAHRLVEDAGHQRSPASMREAVLAHKGTEYCKINTEKFKKNQN